MNEIKLKTYFYVGDEAERVVVDVGVGVGVVRPLLCCSSLCSSNRCCCCCWARDRCVKQQGGGDEDVDVATLMLVTNW